MSLSFVSQLLHEEAQKQDEREEEGTALGGSETFVVPSRVTSSF